MEGKCGGGNCFGRSFCHDSHGNQGSTERGDEEFTKRESLISDRVHRERGKHKMTFRTDKH